MIIVNALAKHTVWQALQGFQTAYTTTEEKQACQRWIEILEDEKSSSVVLSVENVQQVLVDADRVWLCAFQGIRDTDIFDSINTTLQTHLPNAYQHNVLMHIALPKDTSVKRISSGFSALLDTFYSDTSFVTGFGIDSELAEGEASAYMMLALEESTSTHQSRSQK